MKKISNYHSHVVLCGHAEGNVEDYVKEAIKHGYEEICITDHAPIPVHFVGERMHYNLWLYQMMNKEVFEKEYLPQLDYCINKYKEIKIIKGLEVDFIPTRDYFYNYLLSKVECLVVGIHFFFYNNVIKSSYDRLTEAEMDKYVQAIEQAVATGYFSCLVHPDLYLYYVNEFTAYHEKLARRIIEACIKNDVYLEINANGKGRYPREEFWSIVKQYPEAKIIINSDAHRINDFHGETIKQAISFADKLNIKVEEKMNIKNNSFKTLFVGHRGASYAGVVNNTLSGFKEGVKRGYYALECDVRVTSDGVYYIHHDPTVTLYNNNFTKECIEKNGINPDDDMKKFTWNQIKDLDLYYVYEDKTYYDKLILFEDYIKLCKESNIKCVIELKYTNGINTEDVSKIDGLMEIIKQYEMLDNVMMLTSMRNCLLYIKDKYPLVNLVLLTGETTTNMDSINWCIEHKIHFDGYHPYITQEMIDKLHENDLSCNVWTVNDKEIGQKFIDMKVDFITTDVLVD